MIDPTCDYCSQNTNTFKWNKNTFFSYSSSFDPVSSPSNHLLKIIIYTSFFIKDSTVLQKMDHFDISFAIWKLSRSRELTKPTLLDPVQLPGIALGAICQSLVRLRALLA